MKNAIEVLKTCGHAIYTDRTLNHTEVRDRLAAIYRLLDYVTRKERRACQHLNFADNLSGGYYVKTEDLEIAGRWLAADLAQETDVDMDAEADVASITTLRLACELPLIR